MKNGEQALSCAFCRTALEKSDEETLAKYRKRVEHKDPKALCNMALFYRYGEHGLPVDQAKCVDLFREAASLGFPGALYQIGCFHHGGEMGLQQNEEEALKLFKEAADGGLMIARHNLGVIEYQNGNAVAALRHWRLSASAGLRGSIDYLIEDFERGLLQHEDLAKTLRAFYRAQAEMKSEDRDQFIKYMKETGEYNVEYDFTGA